MTRRLDPARDDAGVRLRTARLRRGMTQIALAEMACISPSFVSMVEAGDRELTRVCDIVALADILRVSPLYLADGRIDAAAGQRPARTVPFPARTDPRTLARHQQLARQFVLLAGQDRRGAGDWLRRLARDATVSSWLLLDQLSTLLPPAQLSTPLPQPRPAPPPQPRPAPPPQRWFAILDGARLRQLRRQHGLSAAELAGKAGVGLSTVTRLERHPQHRCRTRTVARLAAALGTTPATLTRGCHPAVTANSPQTGQQSAHLG